MKTTTIRTILVMVSIFLFTMTSALALPQSFTPLPTQGYENTLEGCKKLFIDQNENFYFDSAESDCHPSHYSGGVALTYRNRNDAPQNDISLGIKWASELKYCGTGYISTLEGVDCEPSFPTIGNQAPNNKEGKSRWQIFLEYLGLR